MSNSMLYFCSVCGGIFVIFVLGLFGYAIINKINYMWETNNTKTLIIKYEPLKMHKLKPCKEKEENKEK